MRQLDNHHLQKLSAAPIQLWVASLIAYLDACLRSILVSDELAALEKLRFSDVDPRRVYFV